MEDQNSFLPTLQSHSQSYQLRTKRFTAKSVYQSIHILTSSSSINRYYTSKKDDDDDKNCFKHLLDQSKDEQFIDKQDKPLIGNEALKKYKSHQKILDRVQEENQFNNSPDSVYTVMLQTARSQTLLPCGLGLLKFEGPRDSIKINNMKYGDKYIDMLQEGIKKSHQFEIFELTDNRITQDIAGTLLQSLSQKAREIILSKNRIGQIGITNISNQLLSKDCRLEVLDLEDNSLGNKLVKELCYNIQINKTLQKLNLSKNYITNASCQAISNMLLDNTNLRELYLFWNQIKGDGGILIFQSLNTNGYLKVLDLSSNSLGIQQSCANAFSDLVINNIELQHIDLSFNYLNLKDTQIIAEGLTKNHTIFGFHYSGNKGYVDSKGFLIPIDVIEEDQGQQQIAQRIKSCKYLNQQRIRQLRDQTLKDCCWICEGWRQEDIWWKPGASGPLDLNTDPTFIHLNYQDFEGLYFGIPSKGLRMSRMLPPGITKYFFTVGQKQITAEDQTIINQCNTLYGVKCAGQEITVNLENINEMNINVDKMIIDQYYDPLISVLPRTKDYIYIPPKKKNKKIIWNFATSLFKPWVRETEEEDIMSCFENDWNTSRIIKIIKNETDIENTKAFMKSIYHQIKDTYKHYSSLNPVGDVWAIQSSNFMQVLQNSKLVFLDTKEANSQPKHQLKKSISMVEGSFEGFLPKEDESEDTARARKAKAIIKSSDLDLKFIGTISGTEKGNPRKPDRGMIRFQFLEVWIRIAEAKYLNNQVTTNICDSIKFLWEDNLKQDFVLYSNQKWRDQRYWNEYCDYCLKHYKSLIEHIFACNSKKKVKPGQKPFMSIQELIDLCQQAGLNQYENFGSSTALLSYNKAMMTQIDELKSDRGSSMIFVEFIEALSRIAEDASLPPYVGAFPEGTDFSNQKLKELPLHYKIESLLILFLDNCAEVSFKLNYKKPDKSFFTPVPDSDDE